MAALIPEGFRGTAAPMGEEAIIETAQELGCEPAAIRAVIAVESRGGFDPQGRPVILFERHYFHRLTGGRFDGLAPAISHPRPGGYGPSRIQYDRLERALELDGDAALRSASWGAFQIMGDNHAACGFATVEGFVAAACTGEDAHLAAFAAFIAASDLAAPLRRRAWAAFAKGYNGPAYRHNRYDEKLAAAYLSACAPEGAILSLGARGQAVERVQRRLALEADGIFGPLTRDAVRLFQAAHDLVIDGIVGPRTRCALFG